MPHNVLQIIRSPYQLVKLCTNHLGTQLSLCNYDRQLHSFDMWSSIIQVKRYLQNNKREVNAGAVQKDNKSFTINSSWNTAHSNYLLIWGIIHQTFKTLTELRMVSHLTTIRSRVDSSSENVCYN